MRAGGLERRGSGRAAARGALEAQGLGPAADPGRGAAAAGRRRARAARRLGAVVTEPTPRRILRPAHRQRRSPSSTDRHEVDLSFSWRDRARFRVNGFRQRGSVAVAMRLIPYDLPDLDDAGRARRSVAGVHRAAPGPGARHRADRVGQVDDAGLAGRPDQRDPAVPHPHDRGPDRVRAPSQGWRRSTSARSAPTPRASRGALRAALREDPDVILVGEMRDLETIQTALTIAETGHLVFATLHTNDSPQALDRIVDVFPGDQQAQIRVQLANALTGIVYQRLLPRVGRRAGGGVRGAARHAGGAQPGPRGQDPPAAQRPGDRLPGGHADPRAVADRARRRRDRRPRRWRSAPASTRTRSLAPGG